MIKIEKTSRGTGLRRGLGRWAERHTALGQRGLRAGTFRAAVAKRLNQTGLGLKQNMTQVQNK